MRTTLILGLLLMSAINLLGQNASDSIEVKKALGVIFLQHGKRLAPRNLLEICKSNAESYAEMKTAKGNYDVGSVFGFIGGFMVGWPIGTAIGGGEPNWTLAAIGGGLIVVSIPFSSGYSRHAKKAVEIYNNGLKNISRNDMELKLGLTGNGFGIKVIL